MAMSKTVAPLKKRTFLEWARSRDGQKVFVMIAFMVIPLVLLFTFTYLPFAEMFGFSFYKMKYVGERKFVGLKNYIKVFERDDCFGALKLSLYYMAGSIVQLALSLYLATVLSFKVKGGNIFKGFMFFPYLINGIAVGFIFKFFYTRGFVFDTVLQWCGFQLDNLPYWLKDQSINNISLVATSVWRYFGQNMVLFIGAIMSVDSELYEAAMLDGANKFQQFIYIILPSIKTIITLNVILSITGSLSAFEPPYVITDGANGTHARLPPTQTHLCLATSSGRLLQAPRPSGSRRAPSGAPSAHPTSAWARARARLRGTCSRSSIRTSATARPSSAATAAECPTTASSVPRPWDS